MIVSLERPAWPGPTATLRTGRLRRRSSPTAGVSVIRSSSSRTVTAWTAVMPDVGRAARGSASIGSDSERARRDHREHVGFLLDHELDQRRARARACAAGQDVRRSARPRSTRHPGMPYASASCT